MSLSGKLKDAVSLAIREFKRTDRSSAHFDKPEIPATVLFVDCQHKLGPDWCQWEPETLWLSLPEVSHVNREKILAAAALVSEPAFYWDWRVMGNTALAFANVPAHAEEVPEPSPAQLAWAAFEAELIFALSDDEDVTPHFDEECARYVAVILHDNGWVRAPDILDFAQEDLNDLLNPEGKELASKVKDAWTAQPRTDLEHASFEDTALGVQLARQADLLNYLESRADSLRNSF